MLLWIIWAQCVVSRKPYPSGHKPAAFICTYILPLFNNYVHVQFHAVSTLYYCTVNWQDNCFSLQHNINLMYGYEQA